MPTPTPAERCECIEHCPHHRGRRCRRTAHDRPYAGPWLCADCEYCRDRRAESQKPQKKVEDL